MTRDQLIVEVVNRSKLLGAEYKASSVKTMIISHGVEAGLVRNKAGLYKCTPAKATYAPTLESK